MLKRWELAISLFAFARFGRDPNLSLKAEM